jgi:hypothetical protein
MADAVEGAGIEGVAGNIGHRGVGAHGRQSVWQIGQQCARDGSGA